LIEGAGAGCPGPPFEGLDGRLAARTVAVVPLAGGSVKGFEVRAGNPVVAFERSVWATDGRRAVLVETRTGIDDVALASPLGVVLRAGTDVFRLTPRGLVPFTPLHRRIVGTLHGSGAEGFLEVVRGDRVTSFVLRAGDGAARPLVKASGTVQAAAWNDQGLVAVVDDRVLVHDGRTGDLVQIAQSPLVRDVFDVTLVGHRRAILATPKAVILVSDAGAMILVVARARPRFSDATLYLLDERTGLLVAISGLDAVGRVDADQAYARSLLVDAPAGDRSFAEAVRIVGCDRALRWRRDAAHASR